MTKKLKFGLNYPVLDVINIIKNSEMQLRLKLLPPEDYLSEDSESDSSSSNTASNALSKDKSMYKSRMSGKSSNWWDGEEEEENEDEEEVDFNPNFELTAEEEAKIQEVDKKLEQMSTKGYLNFFITCFNK
jgi:hypothetical protein